MRDGWKETLTALAQGGVPTFVFSSGYGDVIAQVRKIDLYVFIHMNMRINLCLYLFEY
jgi:hypothetical protein